MKHRMVRRRTARVYRQERRAQQTDANTDRILGAAAALLKTLRRVADLTLDDISAESGLTVRTILRRFGSREGVLEAAFARVADEIRSLRPPTPPGDVDAAVASLMNQYEKMGDFNIRALEAEDQLELLHRRLEKARQGHRAWLSDVFAPNLAALSSNERERRLTALYAATDVGVWKLLRRDLHRSREDAHDIVGRLIRGVLA